MVNNSLRVEVRKWSKIWNDSLRLEVWKWNKNWSAEMTVWELKCENETRVEVVNWLFESWSAIMKQELRWWIDYLRVEVLIWSKSWSHELTVWELKC